jgi:hypothetical protein
MSDLGAHDLPAARQTETNYPQTEIGAGIAASPDLRRAKDLPVFVSLD